MVQAIDTFMQKVSRSRLSRGGDIIGNTIPGALMPVCHDDITRCIHKSLSIYYIFKLIKEA